MEGKAAPVNPSVEVEGPSTAKRKRGWPHDSNGAVLSPDPISAIPLPQQPDEPSPFQRGRDFTPHIITVNAGEDVGTKIMSACTKYRAISVLSANGSISLVMIRRPNAAGCRVIYEGHFDIVSLNGPYMPQKNGSLMCKCGGLSVCLVDGEGKTIAGALDGMLIAESNVMVMVGSFLPNGSNQRKRKRAEIEPSSGPSPTMGPPHDREPMNPNGGQMSSTQAGLSAQPGSSRSSGPGPTMGPSCGKEPMNPNGGGIPDFSPASSSQAGSSAQHGSSQDNRDPGTETSHQR